MRDDAVPDVCDEFAARASAAVRNRLDFDILAANREERVSTRRKKERQVHLPRVLASPKLARTFPVPTPIMPRPFDSSKAPTSSSASPNAIRFVSFRSSVCAYASLALRALDFPVDASEMVLNLAGRRKDTHRLPPRRFLGPSFGMASAFTTLDGGGAVNRSSCFSMPSLSSAP
jgi:hypothetical protein